LLHICILYLIHFQNQIVGVDDRNNWNELQSNFCSVIIVSILSHSDQAPKLRIKLVRYS
jgi:hypothetical protein